MNMSKDMVCVNFNDRKAVLELMKKHGNVNHAFMGQNEDGEVVMTSIYPDRVVLVTYQDNGYIHTVIYHKNGKMEEKFERDEE